MAKRVDMELQLAMYIMVLTWCGRISIAYFYRHSEKYLGFNTAASVIVQADTFQSHVLYYMLFYFTLRCFVYGFVNGTK